MLLLLLLLLLLGNKPNIYLKQKFMKKLFLAICLAFLAVGAHAGTKVKTIDLSKESVNEFFQEVAHIRLVSKCGVSWSGYMHYESSWLPSVEALNFYDRLHDAQEAVDAACGTNNTKVAF